MPDENGSHVLIEYGIDRFRRDGIGASGNREDRDLEWEKRT